MKWSKLKEQARDGDALFRQLRKAWRYCCCAGIVLFTIDCIFLGASNVRHSIPSGERLINVEFNLFTTRFITDHAVYTYFNYICIFLALSILVGLILCGICLCLGQKAEYKSENENEE